MFQTEQDLVHSQYDLVPCFEMLSFVFSLVFLVFSPRPSEQQASNSKQRRMTANDCKSKAEKTLVGELWPTVFQQVRALFLKSSGLIYLGFPLLPEISTGMFWRRSQA